MAYSVLPTVVTGTPISSTTFGNVVKANFDAAFPLGVDGWTPYTPTLTQSGSAVTKTVTYARYIRVGRHITVQMFLDVTGTGTAATGVVVGLPVVAFVSAVPLEIGTGTVFDTSAGLAYKGHVIIQTGASGQTVTIRAAGTSVGVLGSTDFTAALDGGDQISLTVTYEAAS